MSVTVASETWKLRRLEGVEVYPFYAAGSAPSLLAVHDGRRYHVFGLAASILQGESAGDLRGMDIASLAFRLGSDFEAVEAAVAQLGAAGLVDAYECERRGPFAEPQPKSRYLALRVTVIPARAVNGLARLLGPLFTPGCASMLAITSTLLVVYFLIWYTWRGVGVLAVLTGKLPLTSLGADLAVIVIGNYLGVLLHELSHAAACVEGGGRCGPVGIGIYLVFPVFYTDVSDSWRLPRSRRIMVDSAGDDC
jgi:putative peptide zinc metalloprotease protein